MNVETILKDFLKHEKDLRLDEIKYDNFDLWRLYRFHCRQKYIKKYIPEYSSNTQNRNTKKWLQVLIKKYIYSFFQFFELIFCGKRYDNLVFAFPRLQKIMKDMYMDKFTDPVIDNSVIGDSVRVFQMTSRTIYVGERWKNERVINNEFLVLTSIIFALLLTPIISLPYLHKLNTLYKRISSIIELSRFVFIKWCYLLTNFKIQVFVYRFLYKRLKCYNIFVVDRMIYLPQIYAAHKSNIRVYEFQHGCTMGETVLYSGEYDSQIDPDIFLVFGESWKVPYFSMPHDKIKNIGFAYKHVIELLTTNINYSNKTVLMVSSPEITAKIVNTTIDLATMYSDYDFYIRCHPQEKLTECQIQKISSIKNVFIDDNSIDSFIAIESYNHIIGENSSVLFEAISLGKNVGRLSFDGFTPEQSSNNNFYYLQSIDDFAKFVMQEPLDVKDSIYDDFKSNYFNELCKS